jgi:hypothetical protein
MKKTLIVLYTIVLLGGIAIGAIASETEPGKSIIVDDDIFIVFVDEPQHHYMRAFENFIKHDWEAAAVEIRKGAAFVKLEAGRAAGDVKSELTASAQMLDKLADDVENGVVRSSKDIQDVFAKAEHAVAEHHYLRATEAWSKKSIKDAGHELHAAAVSLEHGFAWAGKKLEAGVVKVLDDSRHIAGKLIEGADWTKDEIGEGIEYLGREVEKFGKTVAGL